MFHSFRKSSAKWFDSLTDDWNPIIVRDLRRMWRCRFILFATLAHLSLLTVSHVVDLMGPHAPEIFLRTFPTCAVVLAGAFLTVERMLRSRLSDELFDTVPLTPEETVHGHVGTSCLLSAFFLVQALPFLAFPSVVPFSVPIRLGLLLVCFIVAQVAVLYALAFFARTKSIAETVIAFFVAVFFGGLAFQLPMLFMTFFWGGVLGMGPLSYEAVANPLFIAIASAFSLMALISLGYVVYLLTLYHYFDRSGSFWRTMSVNLSCFAVWSLFWSGVAFEVALLFCWV